MGLFDYVKYEAPCWRCGKILRGWQSKDADCEMKEVEPSEVVNFYTDCRTCGAWNEFIREMLPTFRRNESAQESMSHPDLRSGA